MIETATIELPFGIGRVTPMTADAVCDWILSPVAAPRRARILANLNLHGAYLTYVDDDFRELTASGDRVLIDGWPILQLAKSNAPDDVRPTTRHRIGSTDWLDALVQRDPNLLVVAVGGSPETAAGALDYVSARTSSLRWAAFDGYGYEPCGLLREDERTLDDLLRRADVVLVGLGMPIQERWILDRIDTFAPTAVVANVGGCLDYFAGTQKLAPRWMGALGLEWMYRFVNAPTRLASRYFWEPFKLAAVIGVNRGRPPGARSQRV